MMQMLAAGGIPPVTDGLRLPDADNPRGYFEHAGVKRLGHDPEMMASAPGKAIKVISALLADLPAGWDYRVLFMRRPLAAVLASQATMLRRWGATVDDTEQERLATAFTLHLERVRTALEARADVRVMDVDYHALLAAPLATAARVRAFLETPLDVDRMASAVDPQLCRHRTPAD